MRRNWLLVGILAVVWGAPLYAGAQKEPLKAGVNGKLTYIGVYSTGSVSETGGVAKIARYNKDNKRLYLANGALGSLDIVNAAVLRSRKFIDLPLYKRIDMNAMGEANSFHYGTLTGIAISAKHKIIALAVQHRNYFTQGYIVLVDYEGNYIRHYDAGVQPEMICFTPDEQYILTADEGEPREGYAGEAVDPPGTVTIVKVDTHEVRIANFEHFDREAPRSALVQSGVILTKGTKPSLDFEPEHITVSENSRTAWVSLPESNAVAVLDISTGIFSSILPLGFKDFAFPQNSVDVLNDGYVILDRQNMYGAYMPDGIAVIAAGGKRYLLSANKGATREWVAGDNAYTDIAAFEAGEYSVEILDTSRKEGIAETDKRYLFGARSFAIWEVSGDTINLVYDSGNEFELRTGEYFPENFNAGHTNPRLDDRSAKKGPEPEYVEILKIKKNLYALIGLERIGGIMVYNINNPESPVFYDYINTRDFSGLTLERMGDLGPEGICAVEAGSSPTRRPLLFVANEVSGTVAVYDMK